MRSSSDFGLGLEVLPAERRDRTDFPTGNPIFLNLRFHRVVVADDRARQHEHEPEDRPQHRRLRSWEVDLLHACVKRQDAAPAAQQVQHLRGNGQQRPLRRCAVDVDVGGESGAAESPHLAHVVGAACHRLVLGAGNVAALSDVEHDTFVTGQPRDAASEIPRVHPIRREAADRT